MSLTLIIPCYNEEKNINFLIKKIIPLKEKYDYLNIIIVNNGSADRTKSLLLKINGSKYLDIHEIIKQTPRNFSICFIGKKNKLIIQKI